MHPMSNTTYNGYRNAATYRTALWLTNEEPLYRTMCEHFREEEITTANARFFCNLLWPNAENPDGDELADVYWPDIVRVIQDCTDIES